MQKKHVFFAIFSIFRSIILNFFRVFSPKWRKLTPQWNFFILPPRPRAKFAKKRTENPCRNPLFFRFYILKNRKKSAPFFQVPAVGALFLKMNTYNFESPPKDERYIWFFAKNGTFLDPSNGPSFSGSKGSYHSAETILIGEVFLIYKIRKSAKLGEKGNADFSL